MKQSNSTSAMMYCYFFKNKLHFVLHFVFLSMMDLEALNDMGL